jgi:hypothetical protein
MALRHLPAIISLLLWIGMVGWENMIRITYDDIKKVRASNSRRIGIYAFMVFSSLLILSYVHEHLGDIDRILMRITDVIVLRIVGWVGCILSGIIIWKGENLFRKGKKTVPEDVRESVEVFEKYMRGNWA